MKTRRKRNPELSYEAGDLILFADNTEPLYKDKQRAIRRVVKSLNRGTYSTSIGVHIWRPFVNKAAGRYRLELRATMPRSAITEATKEYEKDALAEIMTGDWEWVEELIPRPKYTKGNPMAKRKTKRKATPAQLRALAKGRRTLAARRKTKKKTRRRNPAYGNYSVARGVVRQGWPKKKRTPTRSANPCRASKQYGIQVGSRYFDGAGMTSKKEDAARWRKLNPCKRVAQKLADATGKDVAIVGM